MNTKLLLGWSLLLLLAGCDAPSALDPLVVDGQELHASLVTRKLNDASRLQVPRVVLPVNPYLSTDAEFVDAIAHRASQGRLGGEGIRAALYALYLGESELGLYGLEAASTADADRLEGALRGIWAYSESLGRARVHREGKVLVVVWHGGVSPSCWEAVNAGVMERLRAFVALGAGWPLFAGDTDDGAASLSCGATVPRRLLRS
jgi:hypothetical protein